MQTTLQIHIDHLENYFQVVWQPRGSRQRYCLAEGYLNRSALRPEGRKLDTKSPVQVTDISKAIYKALHGEITYDGFSKVPDGDDATVLAGETITYEMGAK